MTMAKHSEPPLLDRTTLAFAAVALLAVLVTAWLRGGEAVQRALVSTATTIVEISPQIGGGLLIAGLVQVLIPKETVSRWLGEGSGMRGLVIAEFAGALTPGGPFGSFSMVYALGKLGVDIGVLITYLTAWTTLSLLRLVVWEIPFLGLNLSLFRFFISLPMGIVAGLLARRLAKRLGWATTAGIVR